MGSLQETLRSALVRCVEQSKSPGAAGYVGDLKRTFLFDAFGARALVPIKQPAAKDTLYDLASLTKVVATTTAVLLLRDDGMIDLDAPVSTYVPIPVFQSFTVRHLLTHTSGMAEEKPIYKEVSSLDEIMQRYAMLPFRSEPGTRRQYSDVGFMILGRIVELVARDSLDAFCRKRIFSPLRMESTTFNPPSDWADRCAATEQCAWRNRVIRGEVHDENACAVGGVAGHAGLFSTAGDLARFCRELLKGNLLSPRTLDEMTCAGQVPSWPWQGLGWQLDPWSSKDIGFLRARTAFGHSGWTGTALWMDRNTGLSAILLGNTCHPSRNDRDTPAFRRIFYSAVSDAFYPASTSVHTGLDRLVREDFDRLRGRRVAVLTHHAAVDQFGRHIFEVFKLAPDVDLRIVYSPEHGLRGQAEAGAKVVSEARTVPVISLYGDRKRPSRSELGQVDVLVVDLQDVGSRYYTYVATMRDCLAACAESGTPVLILDRPNPVGGLTLEGPIADRGDFPVCWGRVPVRHGMTLGELAEFFRDHEFKASGLDVSVSRLDNWRPGRLFDQCALPWVPPSPNIPTPETTLLYVGTCLFEGTNLNEGRGTGTPFQVVGAPWLDADGIINAIRSSERAGCKLAPVTYTPKSMPGKATHPRYQDQVCNGIRIKLERPEAARPFTLALALLVAIAQRHQDALEWGPSFDVLAGSTNLRERIQRGDSALEIVGGFGAGLKAFDEQRPKSYGNRVLPNKESGRNVSPG